jgi:hypothetical protein
MEVTQAVLGLPLLRVSGGFWVLIACNDFNSPIFR